MATDNAQSDVKPVDSNNGGTQQQHNTNAAMVKENKEPAETIFDKIFIRICLYIIPVLLFIALPDFTNTTSLFTGNTEINYVACYGLYIVVIELLRKIHTTADNSTRALHVFNQSFVYVPLSLFLFTASYALYSAGSEVFGVQPAEQRQAFVQDIDKFLTTYKAQCLQASASTKEQHQCIENYLNATLFADVKLLQEKYGDASNSYSIIAIMTGFFGVLMTVLVIYFSLSGRELLEHKLARAQEVIKDTSDSSKLANEASSKANDAATTAKAASAAAKEASTKAAAAAAAADEASTAATAASSTATAASATANEASAAASAAATEASQVARAANTAATEALNTAKEAFKSVITVNEMVSKLNKDVSDMKKAQYVVQIQAKNDPKKEGIGEEAQTNKSADKSSDTQ